MNSTRWAVPQMGDSGRGGEKLLSDANSYDQSMAAWSRANWNNQNGGSPIPVNELDDPDVLDVGDEHLLLRGSAQRRLLVWGDGVAKGTSERVEGYRPFVGRPARPSASEPSSRLGVPEPCARRRHLRVAEPRESQLHEGIAFAPDLTSCFAAPTTGGDVVLTTLLDIRKALTPPEPFASRLNTWLGEVNARMASVAQRRGGILVELRQDVRAADAPIRAGDLRHPNARGDASVAARTMHVLPEGLVKRRAIASSRAVVE
jgi:hypothetical protein